MDNKHLTITVAQWQVISDIVANEDNELLRWLDIMPMLTGVSKDEYRKMPLSKFWQAATPYLEQFEKAPAGPLPTKWEIAGKTFKCVPQLDKMTAGQFIDALELGKEKGKENQNIHLFLAIWWHEDGKEYTEGYQERSEFIKKFMPMNVALPTYEHFFQLWIASLPAIQRYLSKEAAQIGSQNGGDGTPRSTGWQRVKEKIGMFLRRWGSSSSSTTSPT